MNSCRERTAPDRRVVAGSPEPATTRPSSVETAGLTFGPLPPPKGVNSESGLIAAPDALRAELKAHPGEWACIRVCSRQPLAGSYAQQVRLGGSRLGPDVEAYSRTVDGEFRVYARYVGDAS